jgi:hypothetical protein
MSRRQSFFVSKQYSDDEKQALANQRDPDGSLRLAFLRRIADDLAVGEYAYLG